MDTNSRKNVKQFRKFSTKERQEVEIPEDSVASPYPF